MSQKGKNNPAQLSFLDALGYKPSVDELREQINFLNEKSERLRKGLYARQTAIEYKNECLHKELEFLKSHICKG